MTFIGFPISALIYIVLVLIIHGSKKRVAFLENKYLIGLMFLNLLGLILELCCYYIILSNETITMLRNIILKSYVVYIGVFNFFLNSYIFLLTNKDYIRGTIDVRKKIKKYILFSIFPSLLYSAIVYMLPLYIFNENGGYYTYGPSVDLLFVLSAILITTWIVRNIMAILRRKNTSYQQYAILISIVLFGLVGMLVQFVDQRILVMTSLHSFVLVIMYFTIENPDVNMINQLLRNQELVEEQMEGKSRFLFEMSQDIKEPTNNILGVVNTYDELNNDEKEEAIKIIGDNANELLFKLNNVLNVSSMDASKIKIVNEEYNPKILLNGIKSMALNAIGEKQIKLNFEVSESLPNKLSGDDVRLKQIIMSVLYNCINHTETGVINVNVDSIVRYDVARLMIKIEDTGIGMDLDTINKIIDDNQELNKMDIEKLDKLDVDLKVVVKIIKLLGGNFMIKSDKGRGSTFTIVLDQKCEMENLANSKELEKYTSDAFGKKRVLVVDDNKDELFKISDILGKKDININTSMIGKECVDRIRSGELYNLIIIDDELKITSGYSVLKELNSLEKFKIPVIIMLEKDKAHLKEHYIEDGFKDVILKENLTEELDRISNSYL